MDQTVVITGLGAICALGENSDQIWKSIEKGHSGIDRISRFDVNPFSTKIAALAPLGDTYDDEEKRLLAYGCLAAKEALVYGNVTGEKNISLILGTCNGILGKDIHYINDSIAENLAIDGLCITFSTACASSTQSIAFAADLVQQGIADIALAGGVDILNQNIYAGFHSLGLLAQNPCSPFSIPAGTTLGEGAAFILLESEISAKKRNKKPLAYFAGYGFSADAYHDTKPDPSGIGMSRAIESALKNAGLETESIDYLNAHGTGTLANDSSEWRGIKRVFDSHAENFPISSSKSFLGHTQGASGAMEAIITLLSMKHQVATPTLNFAKPSSETAADFVFLKKPRPHFIQKAISINAGFGGINAALIFSNTNGHKKKTTQKPKIFLSGTGQVNNPDSISLAIPKSLLRGMDISTRLLAGAISLALEKSAIRMRSPACEDLGLFVGQTRVSQESADAFEQSVKERGLNGLSAAAFTRMVVNFATGACCRLFGLKGPATTMTTGMHSGLTALVLAANYLARRNDVHSIMAAAVDEAKNGEGFKHNAASILLTTHADPKNILLAGWALANDSETAIRLALERANLQYKKIDKIAFEGSPLSAALSAVVMTTEKLGKGENGPFLISSSKPGSVSTAVVLKNEELQ